jgi:hypothetical protein
MIEMYYQQTLHENKVFQGKKYCFTNDNSR